MNQRTHILIPQELAQEIEALVGKRGRSQFLTQAARKELKRLKVLAALKEASGAWEKRLKRGARASAEPKAVPQPSAAREAQT